MTFKENEILNCWEYFGCGRESGGQKAKEKGVCPTSVSKEHNDINRGVNAGRYCWKVAGTLGEGKHKDTCSQYEKMIKCINCPFYQLVQDELSNLFVG